MKHSVLSRYLVKEVGLAMVAVTFVLVGVLVTSRLVNLLSDAASGKLPAGEVFTLLGLALLANLNILLPAGFFLGAMLAFGRLYRDSEMTALIACGAGPRQIYRAIFLLSVPLAGLVLWISLSLGPWAQREAAVVHARAQQNVDVEGLRPGRFVSAKSAAGVVYAESAQEGRLRELFVHGGLRGRDVVVTARSARQSVDAQTGERFLVLEDGYRFEGTPGTASWRVVRFEEHGLRVPDQAVTSPSYRRRGHTLEQLRAGGHPGDIAEIQWRFSAPLMLLVLALIAVPLSKSEPRDGRYGKLLAAVLVFAMYSNLLSAGQEWVKDGKLPTLLGLWWVHAVFAVFGIVWLIHRFGLLRRARAA